MGGNGGYRDSPYNLEEVTGFVKSLKGREHEGTKDMKKAAALD
jgi:hypothetical protein